jgi:hypothetical protein
MGLIGGGVRFFKERLDISAQSRLGTRQDIGESMQMHPEQMRVKIRGDHLGE